MSQAEIDDSSSLVSEGMSEIEKEFVELFEQGKVTMPGQVVNATDPADANDNDEDVEGAVADAQDDQTDDEELDDDAAEDAQADDEADASTDESGDGEGEDGAGDGEEEAVTATIVAPDSPLKIGEVEFSPAEVVDMQRAYEWSKNLEPQHIAAINDLFSGNYELTPVGQQPVAQPPAAAQTAQTAPTTDSDYEPLDPVVAAEVERLKQEVETLHAAQASTQADRQAAQIHDTYESFIASKELDAATGARLQQAVFDNGWLPLFVQQTGGDIPRATYAAFDFAYQNDAELRTQEIQRMALAESEKIRLDTQASSAKKRKAGSLGGAGGSVSRKTRAPSTPAEMKDAMVSEIASHMNGGQDS